MKDRYSVAIIYATHTTNPKFVGADCMIVYAIHATTIMANMVFGLSIECKVHLPDVLFFHHKDMNT